MHSQKPNLTPRQNNGRSTEPDARWGNYLVQTQRTDSLRDIRSALLEAAYGLKDQSDPHIQHVCVLYASRVSPSRMAKEWEQFSQVVDPSLVRRIHMLNLQKGQEFESPNLDREFLQWVRLWVLKQAVKESPRGVTQRTVFAHLVRSWLNGVEPETIKSVQEATLLSYPTVAKVLDSLEAQGALLRTSDRRVGLTMFPWSEWRRWAVAGASKRTTLRFIDPTGLPVSPERMIKRLRASAYSHVAVSGILGAKHYLPELDIRGDIRLDLVASQSMDAFDLDISDIDPALVMTDQLNAKPALVVHFPEKRRDDYFDRDGTTNWADPIDCLADLYELRLDAQAEEMLNHLIAARPSKSIPNERT
jgi:hypothetical protein